MEEQSKFKILMNNLTPSQRIGMGLGLVIFICIIVLGVLLIPTGNNGEDSDNETASSTGAEQSASDNISESGSNSSDDDSAYVDPETTPLSTNSDYNDIDTYLPHAAFVEKEDYRALRYYIDVYGDEKPGVISIEYSDCDSAAKTLADEYLKTIPTNLLAEYTIEYETFSEDAYCAE